MDTKSQPRRKLRGELINYPSTFLLQLSYPVDSVACGAIFRRIEEVDKENFEDRQVLDQDVEQANRLPEDSSPGDELQNLVYGPSRPEKRKRERHNALTNMRKFRRIQMITRVEASDSSSESALEFPSPRQSASSYWLVAEEQNFKQCLTYFGTDFQAIANHMSSKTQTMVRGLSHYLPDTNAT